MTALFESTIFGPIHSRRLGLSLGVNLLPERAKICNFDCVYCECGSNRERVGEPVQRRFADAERVIEQLGAKLAEMVEEGTPPDVITFAGNGEPTLHPHFEQIIAETIKVRNRLCPTSKISVLSNATTLHRESVVRALRSVDNSILKLDSAINSTAKIINRPTSPYDVESVVEELATHNHWSIVQTMFLRGEVDGILFDNTTEEEVSAWLAAVERVRPRSVMIYSIDRDTPCKGLQRIDRERMDAIGERVRALGVECVVV